MYMRDVNDMRRVTSIPAPDCLWAVNGEGHATIKHDGTACLVHQGRLYKRHRVREGQEPPPGWMHWSLPGPPGTALVDVVQDGHGWLPVDPNDPSDKYHVEAVERQKDLPDGTYELMGPKIQGNPEGLDRHELWKHGEEVVPGDVPRDLEGLKEWFQKRAPIEGLVFYRGPDRAKIKAKDLGLPWPPK